jgi:hypothetical protein
VLHEGSLHVRMRDQNFCADRHGWDEARIPQLRPQGVDVRVGVARGQVLPGFGTPLLDTADLASQERGEGGGVGAGRPLPVDLEHQGTQIVGHQDALVQQPVPPVLAEPGPVLGRDRQRAHRHAAEGRQPLFGALERECVRAGVRVDLAELSHHGAQREGRARQHPAHGFEDRSDGVEQSLLAENPGAEIRGAAGLLGEPGQGAQKRRGKVRCRRRRDRIRRDRLGGERRDREFGRCRGHLAAEQQGEGPLLGTRLAERCDHRPDDDFEIVAVEQAARGGECDRPVEAGADAVPTRLPEDRAQQMPPRHAVECELPAGEHGGDDAAGRGRVGVGGESGQRPGPVPARRILPERQGLVAEPQSGSGFGRRHDRRRRLGALGVPRELVRLDALSGGHEPERGQLAQQLFGGGRDDGGRPRARGEKRHVPPPQGTSAAAARMSPLWS